MLEAQLHAYVEQSRDPVMLVDGSCKVRWANSSARTLFHLEASLSYELSDLFEPEHVRRICAVMSHGLISVTVTPPGRGEIEQIALVLDISGANPDSELKLIALKSALFSAEHLTKHEEFLATVTHDLKNPIGAIHGYADVLLDTPAGAGMSERQSEILARIRATSSRVIELIRNYQHLFRMRAESAGLIAPLSQPSCDLRAVLQSVIDYTWREDHFSPILVVDFPEEPIRLPIERVHVERVVANIISNAIKYTPAREKISVSFKREETGVCLMVHNTGSYIPEDELKNLFQQYRRGAAGQDLPGSGLGLYIVKAIIDRFGGTVEVKSSLSEGTTFQVKFPTAPNVSQQQG